MTETVTRPEPADYPAELALYIEPELPRVRLIEQGQAYLGDLYRWLEVNNARLSGKQSIARFTRAHDVLFAAAFQHAVLEWESRHKAPAPTTAMVALGGYGRREQFLRSDVDVLFLMEDGNNTQAQEFIKPLLHLLIDFKLNIGFSTRSVSDCLSRVGMDMESTTSMIESRLLAGNKALFQRYQEGIRGALCGRGKKWFLRAIYQEWHARREKYQSTIYLLEPNIKEGPGGLRDAHTVQWVLFGLTGSTDLKQLIEIGRFNEDQLRRYREAIAMLQTVRNELHIAAGGRTDQLSFAYQPAIATRLGYAGDGFRSAEEVFMADYYQHARTVDRFSQRAFMIMTRQGKSALGDLVGSLRRKRLDAHLAVQGNVIFVDTDDPEYLRRDNSANIMALFERAQRGGWRVSDQTIDTLATIAPDLGPAFRLHKANHERFMRILKGPWNVSRTLGDMHTCGILGKFMPEFERLLGMVRIDHYHHYTVDEHSIKTVEMAERLLREPPGHRTLPGEVSHEIVRWDLLNLALLLHDVGKGYGRGHALRGGQIAQRVGDRLGLPAADIELVRWLVLSHLKLTHASQRRDPGDPQVVRQLADEIGTLDRLKLLYVHSVCDLMGVSPDAWSDWKGQLLSDCYLRIAEALGQEAPMGTRAPAPNLAALRDRVMAEIRQLGDEDVAARGGDPELAGELDDFLRHIGDRYIQATPPEGIARHFLMRRTLNDKNVIAWWLYPDPGTGFSELSVCAHDVPGLFCYTCGALAAKDINIWSARIFSTTDGLAINHFQVTDLDNKPLPAGLRLERLRQDLNHVILGEKTIEQLIEKHRGRPRKRPVLRSPLPSAVQIDNTGSDEFTIIEVRSTDRPGLLYRITKAFSECQLNIHRSLIATEAYGVVDVFYVTDLDYNKIHDAKQQRAIQQTVLAAIESDQA